VPADKTNALPVPPHDPLAKVKEVQDLCRDLLSKPDPELAKRIAFESGELEAFFSSIRANAEQVVDSAHALASIRTLLPSVEVPRAEEEEAARNVPLAQRKELEESIRLFGGARPGEVQPPLTAAAKPTGAPPDPNQFDLGDFFTNVSRSVVDAQRQLDVASMQYARQQVASKVPPALYSIPNVHAEIKAGLSSTDGNGIIVKLISDESQSSFTESTISFDIVSSPPPPGPLGNFTAAVPPFLAVEGADFQRVMDALGKVQPALAAGWEQRAIIVRDLDPVLVKLKQSVILAFVFDPIPAPAENVATDFSAVRLSIYKFAGDSPPVAVPAAQVTAEMVRVLYSAVTWLASVRVQ
jgi:hypothetical protein